MQIELARLRTGRQHASRIARTGFLTAFAFKLTQVLTRAADTDLLTFATNNNIQYIIILIFNVTRLSFFQNFRQIWKSF